MPFMDGFYVLTSETTSFKISLYDHNVNQIS